jgi:CRP-like cAMP-binding protein
MDSFINYLQQFAHLNQQQIDLINSKASERMLQKDELYWEAGKSVRQIGFLTEGILRVFYYNHKAEEITRYFIDRHHLILSGYTVDDKYIPSEYISAVNDCRLTVFSRQDWKELSNTIIGWDTIVQKITNKYHQEKMERRSILVAQDASTRYLGFIEQFPGLANQVPLSYIASYLGITASSLSRIRRNIR